MPGFLGLVIVVLFAAVLFVPRLLRASHRVRAAGTAAVSPARPSPVHPPGVMTEPYAYDNGMAVGEES